METCLIIDQLLLRTTEKHAEQSTLISEESMASVDGHSFHGPGLGSWSLVTAARSGYRFRAVDRTRCSLSSLPT